MSRTDVRGHDAEHEGNERTDSRRVKESEAQVAERRKECYAEENLWKARPQEQQRRK